MWLYPLCVSYSGSRTEKIKGCITGTHIRYIFALQELTNNKTNPVETQMPSPDVYRQNYTNLNHNFFEVLLFLYGIVV